MHEDAPQRMYPVRELFNGARWIVRAGAPWRMPPTNPPPWHTVSEQTQRWIAAGGFAAIGHDPRVLIRIGDGRIPDPSAMVRDSRTRPSTPESGARAGWDGAKRRQGTKLPLAVDTLGQVLAMAVTPATTQDRAQVARLVAHVQQLTGDHVTLVYVDQGYTAPQAAADAARYGVPLEVVKLPAVKRGVVVPPRRWVVARGFGWMARFRRLARDYERLPETTVAGLHLLALAILMLHRVVPLLRPPRT